MQRIGILGSSSLTSALVGRILASDPESVVEIPRTPEPELPSFLGMNGMSNLFAYSRTNVEDAAQGLMARSNRVKGKHSASHRARSNKRKANN